MIRANRVHPENNFLSVFILTKEKTLKKTKKKFFTLWSCSSEWTRTMREKKILIEIFIVYLWSKEEEEENVDRPFDIIELFHFVLTMKNEEKRDNEKVIWKYRNRKKKKNHRIIKHTRRSLVDLQTRHIYAFGFFDILFSMFFNEKRDFSSIFR